MEIGALEQGQLGPKILELKHVPQDVQDAWSGLHRRVGGCLSSVTSLSGVCGGANDDGGLAFCLSVTPWSNGVPLFYMLPVSAVPT